MKIKAFLSGVAMLLVGASSLFAQKDAPTPFATPSENSRAWADSVMKHMSLKEKVGQLLVYKLPLSNNKGTHHLMHKVIKEYKVGGILFSGGTLSVQAALTNRLQKMTEVPLLMTFDGEWGISMRLRGMPRFPKNQVLGCITNDSLIYRYGKEVARECRLIGVHVNFAPDADVNINPDNPVINVRSFGESPQNVAAKVISYSRGLENGGVLSVSKHFPGHGDTNVDSHKALPKLMFSKDRLDSVELYPFRKAVEAGVGGIMVGHLEVPVLETEKGLPSSLSKSIITGLLKDELGFKGLIFTDALEMKAVVNYPKLLVRAVEAGNDLLLVPGRLKEPFEELVEAVKKGEISRHLIDEKCRKILMYKYMLGCQNHRNIYMNGLPQKIESKAYSLIDELQRAAVTVAKNRNYILPLANFVKEVAVVNIGGRQEMSPFLEELSKYIKNDVFLLSGAVDSEENLKKAEKLKKYRRVLLYVDDKNVDKYNALVRKIDEEVPVAALCFTSMKKMAGLAEVVKGTDAVVVAHSDDAAVQKFVASLVCAKATADARLSASIGNFLAAGAGYDVSPSSPRGFTPEDYGMSSRKLAAIDRIANEGIEKGAYPGCQVVILKDGAAVYDKCFGTCTWEKGKGSEAVEYESVYDLASLTKTTATLVAIMKLYDQGKISLADKISKFLPYLRNTNKQNLTIRELLLHESGLPAGILFYQSAIDKKSFHGSMFSNKNDRHHTVFLGGHTWADPNFKFKKGVIAESRDSLHHRQVADKMWIADDFENVVNKLIANAHIGAKRYRYSDVNFIILKQVVEAVSGKEMDSFLKEEFYQPMGLTHTGFLPLNFLPEEKVVPSNVDKFIRKQTLRGFVHDESAAFQGGVSGNAGLFSNAREVAAIYQMIMDGGVYNGKRYIGESTCRLFTTTVSKISRRGLGFDRPDGKNLKSSPCSENTPNRVYGHTGFTGTCAWVDPENRLVYVFLSNRIYPNAWNRQLQKLDIRTRIQSAMYDAIMKKK